MVSLRTVLLATATLLFVGYSCFPGRRIGETYSDVKSGWHDMRFKSGQPPVDRNPTVWDLTYSRSHETENSTVVTTYRDGNNNGVLDKNETVYVINSLGTNFDNFTGLFDSPTDKIRIRHGVVLSSIDERPFSYSYNGKKFPNKVFAYECTGNPFDHAVKREHRVSADSKGTYPREFKD